MKNSESAAHAARAAQAQRVVTLARDWIGTPYRHQASNKGLGCDCLGLVRGVWRDVEGTEPETPPPYCAAWSEVSQREQLIDAGHRHFLAVPIDQRLPGDVLIFRLRRQSVAKHVGILSGPQSFIHAYAQAEVTETALCDFWRGCIAAVFRFPSVSHAREVSRP
ncbi:MAG: NlpC/P60 family protein [Hyphomicrobiales bacterium]|nr:NlpC/P60 family protein [Hyphomicrobiales bacterium]